MGDISREHNPQRTSQIINTIIGYGCAVIGGAFLGLLWAAIQYGKLGF